MGDRLRAYIIDYRDSTLILKARVNNKETRGKLKKLNSDFYESMEKNQYTPSQQDSAFLILNEQLKQIEYSQNIELNISSVKKITVCNSDRPDKKKMINRIDALGYSALGGMLLVGPTLILINPALGPIYGFIWLYSIAVIPFGIASETKQFNLQRTWNIKDKRIN